MIKKIYLSLIFIFISSLLFSQVIQKVGSNGFIDWTEGTVIAKGTALGKADEDNPAKKKLQAKYAAKSVAFRNLAETINGVHITSKTIVKNFVTENDEIRLKVESFIRGASIVTSQLPSGRYLTSRSTAPLIKDSTFNLISSFSVTKFLTIVLDVI